MSRLPDRFFIDPLDPCVVTNRRKRAEASSPAFARRIAAALKREGRRCVWGEFDDSDGFFWGWRTTCGEEHQRSRVSDLQKADDFTFCPHCGAKIERE